MAFIQPVLNSTIMMKKDYIIVMTMFLCFISVWSQNLSVTGSCVANTGELTIEGYAASTTYNGKPVYYHENLPLNYKGNAITEDVYLYYALANEIGTPENRWVISCGGQPYYYNISNSDTAPLGVYNPFDTNSTPNDCGGSLTIAASSIALGTIELEHLNLNYSPNPTASIVTISNSKNITNIIVMNTSGQIMFSKKNDQQNVHVDLSHLTDATYFIKVISDNKEKVIKIIKKG